MDDGHPGLGIRGDLVDLRHGADLCFDLPGDQILDLFRHHAGKRGANDRFADHDRRVFLAREGQELHDAGQDHQHEEANRHP
jgi:hypothetical protein